MLLNNENECIVIVWNNMDRLYKYVNNWNNIWFNYLVMYGFKKIWN